MRITYLCVDCYDSVTSSRRGTVLQLFEGDVRSLNFLTKQVCTLNYKLDLWDLNELYSVLSFVQ